MAAAALHIEPHEIEAARRSHRLEDLIARAGVVELKRQGKYFVGLCPFHSERSASFHVYPDSHFHCFGCGAHGDAIDFMMRLRGVDFGAAVAELAGEGVPTPRVRRQMPRADDAERRIRRAREIWRAASRIAGTVGEAYLRSRGISIRLPPSLRFSPALWHAPSNRELPALIAAVQQSSGRVTAIQRTFLAPDGRGKAPGGKAKLALGDFGAGAVRLAPAASVLGVCEGVESALSAIQLHRIGAWCTLGSIRLSRTWLPPTVQRVIIFADADPTGRREADAALREFSLQGREAEIRFPRGGGDFNDELRRRGSAG